MRSFPLFIFLLGSLMGYSCSKPKVERKSLGINLDSAYMMLTRDVDMLVSDSGLTKYRLTSATWIVYDRADRKQWVFPDTLRMWSVDSLQPGNQLVRADSAVFDIPEDEWILIGNVRIHGLNGEKLYTSQLHWQRRARRLFSNDTTYFYTDGKELRGNKFDAKDDLSQYSIYNNQGNFMVNDGESSSIGTLSNQSSNTESIQHNYDTISKCIKPVEPKRR